MADIVVDVQSAPATPSAGQAVLFVDTTSKSLHLRNDAGAHRGLLSNFSTTSQATSAATRTYITGSSIAVPTNKLQVGTCFRWTVSVTKNANGTTNATWAVAVGTNGTTADTDRVSFTKPTGTSVADEGTVVINAIVRTIGATGVMVGQFSLTHNLQITGHALIPSINVNTVSAGFDMTTANLIVGLTATPGTGETYTFQMVQAECWNI